MPSLRERKRSNISEVSAASAKSAKKFKTEPRKSQVDHDTMNATKDVSPAGILQSSWKFLEFAQFCTTFDKHLQLPSLGIATLEAMLLNEDYQTDTSATVDQGSRSTSVTSTSSSKGTSAQFEDLVKALFRCQTARRQLPIDFDFNKALCQLLEEENSSWDANFEEAKFFELPLESRILALHTLMEIIIESPNSEFGEICKNGDLDIKRYGAIGIDKEGRTYWLFGDDRLYRETAIYTKKKQLPKLFDRPYTYELVCSTVEEWQDFLHTYCSDCKSTKGSQFELVKSLRAVGEAVIAMLEQREQAKQRRKDRLLKATLKAQALEMVPKKRSSRLEQKMQEQEELRKLEEMVTLQEDLEAVQKFEAMEKERRSQEARRKLISHEQDKLRSMFQESMEVAEKASQRREATSEQNLTSLSKNSSIDERVTKMRMWLGMLEPDSSVVVHKIEMLTTLPPPSPSPLQTPLSDMTFAVTGDKTDIRSPVLKNTLRVFLASIRDHHSSRFLDNENLPVTFDQIYGKLVLNEYDSHTGCAEILADIQSIIAIVHNRVDNDDDKYNTFISFLRNLLLNVFADRTASD
ncbi:hypothetical protein INT43_007405 [Umbelopsis isabellina]|uniref:Uncharacterized protein n=1 Tax=Mortierella isabellina TaxID=91625 RepID=A0A8H7PZD7_MORIS|nr:hypothetical protein INT43_007405 [Umbelopsis isabellina]